MELELAEAKRFFESIVRREVEVYQRIPPCPELHRPGLLATYHSHLGRIAAVCVSDLRFAAAAGAAMVMLPAAVVGERTKWAQVDETIQDAYREVLNIASRLYTHPMDKSVRLVDVCELPMRKMPEEIAAILRKPKSQLDFQASVMGYPGPGRLWLGLA